MHPFPDASRRFIPSPVRASAHDQTSDEDSDDDEESESAQAAVGDIIEQLHKDEDDYAVYMTEQEEISKAAWDAVNDLEELSYEGCGLEGE